MKTKEKIKVKSSAVTKASYDFETKQMTVEFNHGGVYRYSNMPEFYWTGFRDASSQGKFLNRFVFGKFPFLRLS